jgi:hypothetical protein
VDLHRSAKSHEAGQPVRPPRRGGSKLSAENVAAIRQRYVTGRVTQTALAEEFGVTQSMISAVIRGKTWQLPTTSQTLEKRLNLFQKR